MTQATLILIALAAMLLVYAISRRDESHKRGLTLGWATLKRTLPLLVVAFAIVGYVETLAPQELVSQWLGPNSGWTGLAIGTAAGMLMPGGPYVIFPLIAAIYSSGAGIGPILAMITSWSALALLSVSFELPFLGWRFSVVRLGLGLLVPPMVGLVGMLLFGG